MADWSYAPQYRLYLSQGGQTWSIKSLQSAQCLLTTGQGVNQASIVVGDPDGFIRKTVQPHAMARVELWTANRFGQGGVAWTGYADEVHKAFDPEQGSGVTLACTGPVKLFEITRQSPGDVAGLAIAYAKNVAASSVLQFAAKACGYPSKLLNIHPLADSGSGLQQLGSGAFTQPDQQQWSAVVAALQQNSGVEFFFSARGELFWRQLNFLEPWFPSSSARPRTLHPRVISEDDIIHADFAESDQGIVTDVQVRYAGGGGYVQTAANWPEPGHESAAHKNMVSHLRTRRLVVYAPWILTKPAAQYLAQVLYDQYAAGVAQASVTIPADPLIEIGSLVDVPALGTGGTTRYYVTSCNYQLTWGGAWVMTLGLAFGRAPNQSFPYAGTVTFPALTAAVGAGGPQPARITPWTSGNPYWDESPYSIVAQAGLKKDQAAISSAVYAPGSIIWIWTKPHSAGKLVGPAPLGEYTVVPPSNAAQPKGTIALQSTKSPVGYITLKEVGTAALSEGTATSGVDLQSYTTTLEGTGTGSNPVAVPVPPPAAGSLAQRAFALALQYADPPGVSHYNNDGVHSTGQVGFYGDGKRTFDCAGLVQWTYAQCGYTWGGRVVGQADGGINYIVNAAGIYQWFAGNHGGRSITVDQAQPGDLLFCANSDDYTGITHVAFCSKAGGFLSGEDFAACDPAIGIRAFTIASETGAPFRFAIDTSQVTLNSVQAA